MKYFVPLILAAAALTSNAQTATKTALTPKASAAHKPAVASALPPAIPRVHGVVKPAFTLRYEDVKIGTGAAAEPNKMYKINYTGWVAADGRKFDSTDDHRLPLRDKDGKPIMGDDGKPKLGDPQSFSFAQGFGRLIPGFDQGFDGMRIGGKRRLFIPWQLAYGAHGRPGPDPAHPGIPPKADLIFDVELLDVTDLPMAQGRPGMGGMPAVPPRPGITPPPGHSAGTPVGSGNAAPATSQNPSASAPPAGSAPASGSTTPSTQTAAPDTVGPPATPPRSKPQR